MNLEFRKSLRRKKTSGASPPSVERDVNAEISLKGWLYRLEGSPLKHWKKRWCVLAQYALFVYRDENEHKLLASLLLPGYSVRVCISQDCVSHKNAFVAKHETLKSYYFAADSNAAMCQWRNSMAQSATLQVPPQEHNHPVQPLPQEIYSGDNGRYMDMNALTCVTRSPIYANAPPKPKRVSPPSNRPHSADFLSYSEERHNGAYPSYSQREVRPHTSMRFFDPGCEANNNYSVNYRQSMTTHNALLPTVLLRPKSCLAEPVFLSSAAFTTPCNFEPWHSLPTGQERNMYANNASPRMFAENPHDRHGHLQRPFCLEGASLARQSSSNGFLRSATLDPNVGRSRSPSTSLASSPPPAGTNRDTLFDPRGAVRVCSVHNMASFQSRSECYDPSHNETSVLAHSSSSPTKSIMVGASSGSNHELDSGHDSCHLSCRPNVKQCSDSFNLSSSSLTMHNLIDGRIHQFASRVDSGPFLATNNNSQYTPRKPPSGRTLSTSSYKSTNKAEEIQPSKLEVYRQVPQPSYSTKAANEYLVSTRQSQCVNDIADDSRVLALQSTSSRELESLQSLTDSQYSTAPPVSSLPSLESSSSDFHSPSPVQHFTNIPPHQLRQQNNNHHLRMSEPRAGPPKYSEACLRSEYVQQVRDVSSRKDEESLKNPPLPMLGAIDTSNSQSPPVPSSQREQYSLLPPRVLNSRKLLFDQIIYSNAKIPLEKKKPGDASSYGREDLFKASQLFYNGRVIGGSPVLAMDSRNPTTLDLSFQSSSHNSVFEPDPSVDQHGQYNTVDQPRPTLAQIDSANYAILKQEIEGSKVIVSSEGSAVVHRVSSSSSSCLTRDGGPYPLESVSSSTSRDSPGSQNSIMRTAVAIELDKSCDMHSPNAHLSSTGPATQTPKEEAPRQGTVSEKLAFFESKKSPELSRPKSALSNGSASSIGTTRTIPDLIDELRELGSRSCSRMAISNYICSASSEDILRTITTSKHQRSLSLLEGPAPDVVPAQTPPYYYSDLSLSTQSSIPLDSRRGRANKQTTSTSQIAHLGPEEAIEQTEHSKTHSSLSLLELHSRKLLQKTYEVTGIRRDTLLASHTQASNNSKAQSVSCENLLKKQLLEVPEATQSAICLLESEPFYENIGFGCKSTAVHGPEPQSSPVKEPFLAVSSTEAQKTVSVEEPQTRQSSRSRFDLSVEAKAELAQTNTTRTQGSSNSRRVNQCSQNSATTMSHDYEQSLEGLSPLGPPDVIKSALNSSGDAGEHDNEIFEQIMNSISCPSKIDIPERYVSESDSDADFSAVERLVRYHKADAIRRRLAGHSRDHASRLTINQVIAKQAKHVSKIVATRH